MPKKTKHPGVYRLKDGRFWVLVTARNPNSGKKVRRERALEAGLSVKDAILMRAQLAVELKEELANGGAVARVARITTVADYAELWMARKAKRLKESVKAHYVSALAERILPLLGEVPVSELTRGHVEDWVIHAEGFTTAKGSPYAAATLHSWWRVLGTMLRDAAAEHGILDPTLRVKPPESVVRGVRQLETLTGTQLAELLQAVRSGFPAWYAEVYVLALTGMRPGELYALQWGDIDAEQGCIHVWRAVWNGHVSTTKTAAPRTVALPDAMIAVLEDHRTRMRVAEMPSHAPDLVFPSNSGTHRVSSSLVKLLKTASDIAELPIRVGPQVLRRTFNTLLLESGVNQVVLRAQMGHSSAAMTERYAGIHIERKQEAVACLLDMIHDTEQQQGGASQAAAG